jgi:hypothetical protein
MVVNEERLRRAVKLFTEQLGDGGDLRMSLAAVLMDWEEAREFERLKSEASAERTAAEAIFSVPKMSRFIERAAVLFGISKSRLIQLEPGSKSAVNGCRAELWIALREEKFSLNEIGHAFAARDHSTIQKLTKAYRVGPAERERINWIRGIQQSAEAA